MELRPKEEEVLFERPGAPPRPAREFVQREAFRVAPGEQFARGGGQLLETAPEAIQALTSFGPNGVRLTLQLLGERLGDIAAVVVGLPADPGGFSEELIVRDG